MPRAGSKRAIIVAAGGLVAAGCVAAAWWSFAAGGNTFLHPAATPEMAARTERGATWFGIALIAMAVVLPATCVYLVRSCHADRRPDVSAGRRRDAIERWAQWAVVGCAIAALLLRAARIGESLWYDEIAALSGFSLHGPGAIIGNLHDPANHILHSLLVWVSISLFDELLAAEWIVRLPALLFSIACVPVAFAALREASGRAAPGVFAAVLTAVLPVTVLEGVDGRAYSMMIFFSFAMLWTLLRALRDDRAWQWLLYAALAALGCWAHFVTAFAAIGHATVIVVLLVAGLVTRGICIRGLIAIALGGLISITLYAPALPHLLHLIAHESAFAARSDAQPALFSAEGWHALLQLGGSWYLWAAIGGWALIVLGAASLCRRSTVTASRVHLRTAAALGLAGLPIFVAVTALTGSWMYARFTFFALPGAIVLMAAGIEALRRRHLAAALAACAMIAGVSIAELLVRPPRQPLRDAAEYVLDQATASDLVLAVGLRHQVIRAVWPGDRQLAFIAHDAGDDLLNATLMAHRPRFIIVYYPHLLDDADLRALDSGDYQLRLHLEGWLDWGRGDVVVYGR